MTSLINRFGIMASTLALVSLTTVACAQENSSDTPKEAALIETSEPEMTPIPTAEEQAADDGHGHEGHNHDHAAPDPSSVNIDHVFTRAPDDHVVGNAMAPNTVIIYASVTCPHCASWFETEWPKFKAEQIDTGKTLMIFREIPTPPQQIAAYGFIIANCAPEEKYMDHIVYQMNQQSDIFAKLEAGDSKGVYDDLTARADLTTPEQIDACFQDGSHVERINRASQRMTGAGANTVPTFVINGALFQGDTTADGLNTALQP